MAWSDEARAAAAEARKVHGKGKVTIQSASAALHKVGFKLGTPTLGKDFKAHYPITGRSGVTHLVAAKQIIGFLKGK